MKKYKRFFLSALFICTASTAHAQWQNQNWWSLDYIYDKFKYVEPGLMREDGQLPGFRAEFGINMAPWMSLSFGGQYVSGNLTYDGATFSGTPISTITKDRNWHAGVKAYFIGQNFIFSLGWARRFLYNDLVVSYRREQTYNYVPLGLTYSTAPFYFTYEHRQFLDGVNKSYMSDVDASRRDVTLKQDSGKGFAVEAGYIIPAQTIKTRLSLRYESWDIDESDSQNDNVDDLVEPKNETREIVFGIGLIF